MRRRSTILLGLLLITACTAPARAIPTAAPQEPTTTLAGDSALASINLEEIVIQPGDLPSLEGTVEKLPLGPFAPERPEIANSFARLIMKGENVLGSIYVDVYTDTLDAKQAYDNQVSLLQESKQFGYTLVSPQVGEQALLQYRGQDDGSSMIFLRCHAYVHIRLPASQDTTQAYATRLDRRLTPLVCSSTK